MKQDINDLKNDLEENKNNIDNVYEFAIRQVEQNYKREKFIVRILASIIAVLLVINGYMAYQIANGEYTTTTTTTETTSQDGVYNFYDSEGNMVSSDLSLDEMQELIDLNRGNE